MEVMIAHARDPVTPPSRAPARRSRRPGGSRAALPGQEARRSLSRYAEPRRGPRRVRRRRELVAPARRGVVACPPGRVAAPSRRVLGRDHARRDPLRPGAASRPSPIRPRDLESASIPRSSCELHQAPASARDEPTRCHRLPSPHEPTDERASLAWMTEPLDATIHLAFAFDIGDEIDLDRARLILQGEPGQLPRRRRTPESIGYRPAPIRVDVEPAGIRLPGDWRSDPPAARRADALRLRRDLAVRPVPDDGVAGGIARAGRRLAEPAPLTDAARRLLAPGSGQIRAGRPRLRRQRDERGIHRLPARRAPARLAGSTRRLDRRAGPPRGRTRSVRARSARPPG